MGERKEYYDVVLVQPNIIWVYDPFEHLGLAYLAAALRDAGFKVKIIDAVLLKLGLSELYQHLAQYQIGVLGVTLISHGYLATLQFLEFYRKRHPSTRIIGGGHFATFAYNKILNHTNVFDAIVLGEGEYTIVDYVKSVLQENQGSYNDIAISGCEAIQSGQRIIDLDQLPFPARDNLSLAVSVGSTPSISSSRGCYARCSFCTVPNFYEAKNGPRWVSRSIVSVIEELRMLHHQFQIDRFMFVDDNFMGPGLKGRERAVAFAEDYRRARLPMTFHIDCRAVDVNEEVFRSLYAAGLRSVFLGIESIVPQDLRIYSKGITPETNWDAIQILKKLNIKFTLSMIMFNPLTTKQSILENIRFLKTADYYPRNPLSILNVYEGINLTRIFKDVIYGPFWDYRFKFVHNETQVIYEESLMFCRETLPLERDLSRRPGGGFEERRLLAEQRLLFLEDLTSSFGMEPLENIQARWRTQLNRRMSFNHSPKV